MAVLTVASGAEVKSSHHNALAGWINGTAGYGQPGKLYDFNDANTFSVTVGNQDTTNGLIALFQYGTPGFAIEVARITKEGIIGRIINSSATEYYLDDYSGGVTINSGAETAPVLAATDVAWAAVFALIAANGGGIVRLGWGTYFTPSSSVTWVNDTILRGVGIGATTVKHRSSSALETIRFTNLSNCIVTDMTVDGNRTANNNASTGFISSEVSLGGSGQGNAAYRVKVTNFNHTGIACQGLYTRVIDCVIDGPSLGSYTAWGAFPYTRDVGGFYGIYVADGTFSTGVMISGNTVTGLRNNGIVGGGYGCIVTNNVVGNNHRDSAPAGSGGGQIALIRTTLSTPADTGPRHCIISHNTIAGTSVGTYASGIEINTAVAGATNDGFDIVVSNNTVYGQPDTGINLADSSSVIIKGNTVRGCTTYGILLALGASPSQLFHVDGNIISDTVAGGTGMRIAGATSGLYSITNNIFSNNGTAGTAHFTDDANAADSIYDNNIVGSGTKIPNRTPSSSQWQSSAVAHGMTTLAPTAVYGLISTVDASAGGVGLEGYTESTVAIRLVGRVTTGDTTKSTAAQAAIGVLAQLKSGTSAGAMGANQNLLSVSDSGNTRFIVDAEGDIHADSGSATANTGTGYLVYDEYDDAALIRALDIERAGPGLIQTEFDNFLRYGRADLERAKIATFNDREDGDGSIFVNYSALTRLHSGAIWQSAVREKQRDARIENIERQLLALGAGAE